VTAALGATAYAGIPLTHRDYAQSATFITGHCRAHGDDIQWDSLAKSRQTLAIYMGTIKANEISQSLIEHGKSSQTPVAIISQGTLPSQSVQLGTLQDLPQLAEQAKTPALIVIGEVVNLHQNLQWFGTD
jgi:uroporphyrin-III C-methyltransferase/precorrin-2 dehydrogenase/sirohydrochlorin ferrochelatase